MTVKPDCLVNAAPALGMRPTTSLPTFNHRLIPFPLTATNTLPLCEKWTFFFNPCCKGCPNYQNYPDAREYPEAVRVINELVCLVDQERAKSKSTLNPNGAAYQAICDIYLLGKYPNDKDLLPMNLYSLEPAISLNQVRRRLSEYILKNAQEKSLTPSSSSQLLTPSPERTARLSPGSC